MLHDLKIFQKTYDFLFWIKPVVQRFSKSHKYSLGLQLETEVLYLLKYITRANMSRDNKRALIQECMVRYETTKVLVRLSKDYKLISLKQYEFASDKLLEIGRMLGGWLKRFAGGGGRDFRSPCFPPTPKTTRHNLSYLVNGQ